MARRPLGIACHKSSRNSARAHREQGQPGCQAGHGGGGGSERNAGHYKQEHCWEVDAEHAGLSGKSGLRLSIQRPGDKEQQCFPYSTSHKYWRIKGCQRGCLHSIQAVRGAGPKRQGTTWVSALAVLGAWLPGVIPMIQVARASASGRAAGPRHVPGLKRRAADGGRSRRRPLAGLAASRRTCWRCTHRKGRCAPRCWRRCRGAGRCRASCGCPPRSAGHPGAWLP